MHYGRNCKNCPKIWAISFLSKTLNPILVCKWRVFSGCTLQKLPYLRISLMKLNYIALIYWAKRFLDKIHQNCTLCCPRELMNLSIYFFIILGKFTTNKTSSEMLPIFRVKIRIFLLFQQKLLAAAGFEPAPSKRLVP